MAREHLDLLEIVASYKSGLGQPPFDPRMMTALLLYAYCSGLYSSRRMAKACAERVDFMMIVAHDAPDFRTIADFRKRHLPPLGRLFLQVLKLAEKAGLAKLGHVALDGTKIKANASKHKAMSYERMKTRETELRAEVDRWLEAAEAADAQEDKLHGASRRGDEMPDWIADKQKRLAKIREARQALEAEATAAAAAKAEAERAAEEKRKAENRKRSGPVPRPPSKEPDPKVQRNFTDPDSRVLLTKDGFIQGYNAQAAVDGATRTGKSFPIVVIQEAGLDGFWIHRVLLSEGIESHVVDAASIATSRRRRRAKTDRIDGETLLRALLAHKRGEPRVCSMVRAPTPEDEDRRRICRERKVLIMERVQHVNRIKGLLFSQGAFGYEPLRRDRRARLDALQTGDGRRLPQHLKAQVCRELDRLELLLEQIKAVEAERDALLDAEQAKASAPPPMLLGVHGVGPEFASVLWSEGLSRQFDNRRQVAAYAGLAPTPWQSGSVNREQGISQSGNRRLRTTMIQLAWLWLRHQPRSALTLWFKDRMERNGGRRRKTTIVALARKLLVALWKYVTAGVVIEGAMIRAARR